LTVDHPDQRITGHTCHEQRKQWVFCHRVGQVPVSFAKMPFGLRVMFACLVYIAFALVVCVWGCPCGTVGDIKQRFPHLIQKLLA
jgi:hypothetical protein